MKESITIEIKKSIELKKSVKAFYKIGLTALQVLDNVQAQCKSQEARKECQMN